MDEKLLDKYADVLSTSSEVSYDDAVLAKYAEIFVDGINTKLSQFFIEGRQFFLAGTEKDEIVEVTKQLLIAFYKDMNGQG